MPQLCPTTGHPRAASASAHPTLYAQIPSHVKKNIGLREEAQETELRREAQAEVEELWQTAQDHLVAKLIGPHVTAFARQFFVAMNGPREQSMTWPQFVRGMEERLCQFDIERLMQLYPKDDPERNANLRKAIDLHKAIVSKATDEGLHVMNVAFLVAVIGGLAALAFVTMRNRKVAR